MHASKSQPKNAQGQRRAGKQTYAKQVLAALTKHGVLWCVVIQCDLQVVRHWQWSRKVLSSRWRDSGGCAGRREGGLAWIIRKVDFLGDMKFALLRHEMLLEF